jgi:hypothetical protein
MASVQTRWNPHVNPVLDVVATGFRCPHLDCGQNCSVSGVGGSSSDIYTAFDLMHSIHWSGTENQ